MSRVNELIESRLKTVQRDPAARPIIERVQAEAAKPGATSATVLKAAVAIAQDSYRGKSADQIREKAFLAAAAAATEKPFTLGDLPEGEDKTKHFFVSGVLSLRIAEVADKVLPHGLAAKLGAWGSSAIGWGKEVYDALFATGYNKDDLKADFKGARAPFEAIG